jgi:hypothetical protein
MRIQHLVGHDDHPQPGLCQAGNDAQHLADQLRLSLIVGACKESEPLAVICCGAKYVPPDKPAWRKTDRHAAAAAVFAELINITATWAGCAQQHPPSEAVTEPHSKLQLLTKLS